MSRFHSYIKTASAILSAYTGNEPFGNALKNFFAAEKKYGSRDRKQIAELCYCFFRAGHVTRHLSMDDRLLAGLFLCTPEPLEILEELKPEWNKMVESGVPEKLVLCGSQQPVSDIFPFTNELSREVDPGAFAQSMLTQPDLFLRIRPGCREIVVENLQKAGIPFKNISPGCLALPNKSAIDNLIQFNREAVVQDLGSQRVGEFLELFREHWTRSNPGKIPGVWDCCAGSGGKSILAADILGKMKLTVSDIRESILINLRNRFTGAGITHYNVSVKDLSDPSEQQLANFDLVIADVPCTGSGTWSRTPEQLQFFQISQVELFAEKQEKILANAATAVNPGGYLLYITCSVFRPENEAHFDQLTAEYGWENVEMRYLDGYREKADTLFAALLRKLL
jgi:16S rRNA (cytosine967-C5)-methyltransferase